LKSWWLMMRTSWWSMMKRCLVFPTTSLMQK
jgi:hypothetical protein